MKCLFIGGPKAGFFIDVDDFVSNVQIPIPQPDGFGVFVYHRGYIKNASGDNVCIFYPHGEDPIEMLMKFYSEASHS